MTTMSREANRDSKGLQGRIPNFPKKGKRPGGDKKAYCQAQISQDKAEVKIFGNQIQ